MGEWFDRGNRYLWRHLLLWLLWFSVHLNSKKWNKKTKIMREGREGREGGKLKGKEKK